MSKLAYLEHARRHKVGEHPVVGEIGVWDEACGEAADLAQEACSRVSRAQHRIASTDQHPIRTETR